MQGQNYNPDKRNSDIHISYPLAEPIVKCTRCRCRYKSNPYAEFKNFRFCADCVKTDHKKMRGAA